MALNLSKSREWMARATKLIPGGVNSPVRAFGSVGGDPPFIKRAQGAYLWDEDDNRYIDFIGSWGPMILGHAHPEVLAAIQEAASLGTSYGAPTSREVLLAEKVQTFFPSIDVVRLVSSGTEATMSAIRLARAATQRSKIVKFAGCYHGHGDSFLIAAGSGAATLGVPNSPGVTSATAENTIIATLNDLDEMRAIFEAHGDQIAAIIVEPIPANIGMIPPQPGFLEGLRELTTKAGALLILDEVMTGFRVKPGGAQELFGIEPDLTTLGKIIGGGLPVGAYGGKRQYMEMIAPSGPVYQAGTLSGNPISVAAGTKTLELLEDGSVYKRLEEIGAALEAGIRENLKALELDLTLYRYGSMMCLYFRDGEIRNDVDAKASDIPRFNRYFHAMLERGVHLPPSQFEAFFLSAALTEQDIQDVIKANRESLAIAWDR